MREDQQLWRDVAAGRKLLPDDIAAGMSPEEQVSFAKEMLKYDGDSDWEPEKDETSSGSDGDETTDAESDPLDLD